MDKREAVKEIARCAGTLHVTSMAEKALRGEVSLDRALHEAASHGRELHTVTVAKRAIDGGSK